jgi:hypothetical protein
MLLNAAVSSPKLVESNPIRELKTFELSTGLYNSIISLGYGTGFNLSKSNNYVRNFITLVSIQVLPFAQRGWKDCKLMIIHYLLISVISTNKRNA